MSQMFRQSVYTRVLARSTYVTRQHEFIEQPLQFSHSIHTTSILRSSARRVIGE